MYIHTYTKINIFHTLLWFAYLIVYTAEHINMLKEGLHI